MEVTGRAIRRVFGRVSFRIIEAVYRRNEEQGQSDSKHPKRAIDDVGTGVLFHVICGLHIFGFGFSRFCSSPVKTIPE